MSLSASQSIVTKSINISVINLIIVLLGSMLHMVAEATILPLLVALIYYYFGIAILSFPVIGGFWEQRIFSRVFSIGYLSAGISALYNAYAGNIVGVNVDIMHFLDAATDLYAGMSLKEIAILSEGSLAIVLWRYIYELFSMVGVYREQYVGVLVNVLYVAFSAVVALKMVRKIYGHDIYRFKQLMLLFSACGLIWLFSGILLRDSLVLLSVTMLAYFWLRFLKQPDNVFSIAVIIVVSIVFSIYFGFLRTEFVFVPFAMAMAAMASLVLSNVGKNKIAIYFIMLAGVITIVLLLIQYGSIIQLMLSSGREGYAEAASINGDKSLGMAIIVNQPIPFRILIGSIYLFVFPIPFWIGFQFESVYHLYKSINVIFFYFVIPLLILAVSNVYYNKNVRSSEILFMLFISLGFVAGIAITSLETRHFGAFLVPIFILALLPEFRTKNVRVKYKKILVFVLTCVFFVHISWLAMKYF